MIPTLAICFAALLMLGMPISVLLAVTTAVVLLLFTSTPLTILVQQLFNALDNSVLLAIPFFILAGGIMTEGAIAKRLIAVMNLMVGRFRGGAAMATVVACGFFAALSGSSPATVVAIGSIMFPALVKAGYGKGFTTGLITSAGSLGIVIPPSIPMILYCLVMNVSVAEQFMAGILPGVLIGGVLLGYTYVMARKHGWRNRREYEPGESWRILRQGVWGLLLPVIVLGGIYTGLFTPTEAAAVSVVYALAVEFLAYRELTVARLFKVTREAAVLSSCLLFILACAMTFVWLLTAEQLPVQVADWIMGMVDSWWLFLILVAILFLLMGTIMDDVSAMIILSPLFAETLSRYGIDYVHYGIIMVLVIEFGFLTPPFGLNLFVAMGLTDQPLTTVARATAPFLLLLLACVFLVIFIPEISLFLPKLLLRN
ncbi:MAG: TRAP transporter large permease subunit [Desulfarculaceae bacterium]|nr:TRAP transporter large permease subunit [Desulfarculaceae bacterium]MCF8074213.1 TRAP transporter large permease subunit [Desulfarculaceae bacterium]MCF8103835.1 TRAP transporter large permease subunit [Desulfarculaceae bacterium]MCF8116351.1 TRAP transporter large permease subunit [Desulfarculaceae bacterium]